MLEPLAPITWASGSVDDSDLLNRLTILHWHTAAELAKEIALFRRRAVSVTVPSSGPRRAAPRPE